MEDLTLYSFSDLIHDYLMMLKDFGPQDETVIEYLQAIRDKGQQILTTTRGDALEGMSVS